MLETGGGEKEQSIGGGWARGAKSMSHGDQGSTGNPESSVTALSEGEEIGEEPVDTQLTLEAGPAQERGQSKLNCTHQHSKWQSARNRRGPLQWVSRSEHRGEVPPVTGKASDTPTLKQVVQGH
ncbi:unnamed protein product [Calypogeia fissa]